MIHKIDENILLSDSRLKTQRDYWTGKLSTGMEETHLLLPQKKNTGLQKNGNREKIDFSIPGYLCLKLIKLGKASELSIYIFLLAALKSLIYRYTYTYGESNDITVVSPVYQPDVSDETLNDFLLIRDTIHDEITFKQLLLKVRQSVLDAYDNQDYPLDRLVADSSVTSITCLLENIHDNRAAVDMKDKIVFSFLLQGNENRVECSILFDPHCYERYYIQQVPGHFIKILGECSSDLNTKIFEISYLSGDEKRQLIYEFNDTAAQYPADKTTVELFANQARKIPDNIALVGGNSNGQNSSAFGLMHLSYRELNEKSDQLAYLLKAKSVKPDTIVGIMMDRTVEMIIGIMGILKAGGAYLPLAPDLPSERILYMLEDSSVKVLLTSPGTGVKRETGRFDTIRVRFPGLSLNPGAAGFSSPSTSALSHVSPANLVYIIYTSGSTGKPKAVMVEHRNVINLLWGLKEKIYDHYRSHLHVALVAPYIFDASVKQVFASLLLGHCLFIVPEDTGIDGDALMGFYNTYKIDISDGTPVHTRFLLESTREKSGVSFDFQIPVKHFLIGGEDLPSRTLQLFLACFEKNPPVITNVYGPAECCVDSTCCTVSGETLSSLHHIPIGRPLNNQQVVILDRRNRLQPRGIPGELCIGGDNVGRGYLNNPGLTAQKFISTQASSSNMPYMSYMSYMSYIYKTGDLARWLPDGNLEYLGRMDNQVKIRGYRIESGEIESQLLTHEHIKEVVVVPEGATGTDSNGDNGIEYYLAAYIVSDKTLEAAKLREYLSPRLPGYMIPSHFAQLEKIPLTTNGKIDKRALKQCGKSLDRSTRYVPPADELEAILAGIWEETLHLEKVGTSENFFDIGGNSLAILRVNQELKEVINTEIPVIKMFRYPTVSTLAAYLSAEGTGKEIATPPSNRIKEKLNRDQLAERMEIAVIGMAGRFPGAGNIDRYWENIKNGIESITYFKDEELAKAGIDPGLIKNPNYVKAGGVLENKEFFDASFFGYIPLEAEIMDPQMRIFHEVAWEALENAGYNPGSYNGLIGLYAGASHSIEWEVAYHLSGKGETLLPFDAFQLINKELLSSRISYKLDLKGPAVTIQTKCSTSLVAIHMACRAILAGECHMALAGGVSLSFAKKTGYLYQEGMINSPDGHCRAFDRQANGTVGGEGAGVVLLKSLQEAATDRDTVLAVVKSSAVNNDGVQKVGFTAPSVDGEARVIENALDLAGIDSESIGYIETHGTATPLGDPIEIEALIVAFNTKMKHFCPIGSVKANIGHLDAAAGAAGFIKTVLALKHRQIPPSLHFKTPNLNIDFENSPFYVNTQLKEWNSDTYPPRAGVSSFGIGGTNAHVILEQAPVISHSSLAIGEKRKEKEYQLILLSAQTGTALEQMTRNLACHLKENPGIDLADVAYTLQVGRKTFQHRKMLTCSSVEQAVEILSTPSSPKAQTHVHAGKDKEPTAVFLFSGQGSQYVDMGRELYEKQEVFRREMDRCFEILTGLVDYNLKDILYPGDPVSEDSSNRSNLSHRSYKSYKSYIDQTEIAQPLLFVFEYALAGLLMKWGITPYAMMGHSIGEYVAACLAGVFSLEDALKLVCLRGKLMQKMPVGAMLGVALPEEQLQPLLKGKNISLAAVNSSSLCVVSGPHQAIEAFAGLLTQKRHKSRRLHTSHAYHSAMMEPVLGEFREQVGKIKLNPPAIPFISNLTGDWITAADAVDPGYWAAHIRKTVRFSRGLTELLKQANAIFIEVGPGKSLITFVRQHSGRQDRHRILNLVRHAGEEVPDEEYLLNRLGQLWLYGKPLDYSAYHGWSREKPAPIRIPLPTYPFGGQPYWLEFNADLLKTAAPGNASQQSLSLKKPDIADWFYIPSWELAPLPLFPGKESDESLVSLVFADGHGLAEGLAEKIKMTLPMANHTAVIVYKGREFKAAAGCYTIDPEQKEHYWQLAEELLVMDLVPDRVIHCWNITDETGGEGEEELNPDFIKGALNRTFYSLVYAAQALARVVGGFKNIHFFVLSNRLYNVNGGEETAPGQAILSGPCRLIPREFPAFRCSNIDIHWPVSSKAGYHQVLEDLCAELNAPAKETEPVMAYRGQRRWVQTFRPVRLEQIGKAAPYLRKKGIYLVTGAPGDHGSVGYLLARHLAQHVQARLVLVSRTQLPPREQWDNPGTKQDKRIWRRICQVRELEELGAEVLILSADVSDLQQMRDAVDRAEIHFGGINGIIHAAAVMGKELLAFMVDEGEDAKYEKQFAAKIYGLVTLYRLFRDRELDFCLLASSLASIMGPFAAYAAASSFMDAFAHWANKNESVNKGYPKQKRWISVNWDRWLPLEEADQTGTGETLPMMMTPDEGVEAFHRVLSWGKVSQVLISIEDLDTRLAHLPEKQEPPQGKETTSLFLPGKKPDTADWFYKPAWKESPLQVSTTAAGHWLVFTSGDCFSGQLVRQLENRGDSVTTVEVGAGFTFDRSNPGRYTINPAEADHYDDLFKSLAKAGTLPGKILHLWTLTTSTPSTSTLPSSGSGPGQQQPQARRDTQNLGLYSLVSIARAIGSSGQYTRVQVRLLVVSNGMQPVTGDEDLYPGKATLLGPVKIIPFEYPNISCRSVDIDNVDLIEKLLSEFETDFSKNPVIAYRDHLRLKQYYEPVKLHPPGKSLKRLKENGVYLITGGLGGMGFFIAQHLAKHFKASVLLTDIADFPEREQWNRWLDTVGPDDKTDTRRKIQCILELEKQGAQLMVRQADVSDYPRMQAVIAEAEQQLGSINGIIHTAGLVDYAGVMQRRTREKTEELLKAKVKGTLVLDRLFRGKPLDFLVLFSSAGNVLYGLKFGQVGYNAGHEFMDIYAFHKQKEGIFTVTVDWNDWLEVGMAARLGPSDSEEFFSISPSQGIVVFKRILESPYPQIAVSTYDLDTLIARINNPGDSVTRLFETSSPGEVGRAAAGKLRQRPEISTAYAAPRNEMEQQLARTWQKFFGINQVGIYDDFFELGGDSLKAMTILANINKDIKVKIPLAEFFKKPSVRALAEYARGAGEHRFVSIEPGEQKEYYPLSSAQKRLYVLHQLEPGSIAYNESGVTQLEDDLDPQRLEDIFQQAINRHESFRTSFQLVNEEPVQKIHHRVEFNIEYYDLQGTGAGERWRWVEGFIRPFDLSHAPLMRVGLIKADGQKPVLMFDMNHIITDGISMEIFQKEVMALYKGDSLPGLRLQYKDYAQWQASEKENPAIKVQESYWIEEFDGDIPVLNLPTDYPRPEVTDFEGDSIFFRFSAGEIEILDKLIQEEEVTLFMVILSLFKVMLYRLSGQEDIVVGTPAAGRVHPDVKQVIGMFVNTLALRSRPRGGKRFKEFLAEVKEKTLKAFENQDYQFEDIVNSVVVNRTSNRSPLFDVMFAFHNANETLAPGELPAISDPHEYIYVHPVSKFDMTLIGKRTKQDLTFRWIYCTKLFKRETIERFINYFKEIVAAVGGDKEIKLKDILISHDLFNEKIAVPQMEFAF